MPGRRVMRQRLPAHKALHTNDGQLVRDQDRLVPFRVQPGMLDRNHDAALDIQVGFAPARRGGITHERPVFGVPQLGAEPPHPQPLELVSGFQEVFVQLHVQPGHLAERFGGFLGALQGQH